jgi:hypothetical protein
MNGKPSDQFDWAVDQTLAAKWQAEHDADRLGRLLDAALLALRAGDDAGAVLCLIEGLQTAQRLRQRDGGAAGQGVKPPGKNDKKGGSHTLNF